MIQEVVFQEGKAQEIMQNGVGKVRVCASQLMQFNFCQRCGQEESC